MRPLIAAAVAAMTLAGPALAEPMLGQWRTVQDDNGNFGVVEVAPCGMMLCGTLIQSYDASGAPFASENQGIQIISEAVPDGGGAYRGKIFSPDRGRTYNARFQLTGDQLSVSGCVFGICRDGGTWVRVQ